MDPELQLRKKGVKNIAGTDESGRGPLAGPVIAAAIILKENFQIRGLRDAKEIRLQDRKNLYLKILQNSKTIGISIVNNRIIDKKNILQASLYAMKHAIESLDIKPKYVLVDGNKEIPEIDLPQKAVVAGDKLCRSISAASIVAKVIRDEIMGYYDSLYPQYGFTKHKGYSTKEHIDLLEKYGSISIHRLSYQPVSDSLKTRGIILI